MRRLICLCTCVGLLGMVAGATTASAAEKDAAKNASKNTAKPAIPGLGDPGQLTALRIEQPHKLTLRGRDARRQLVVTGVYSSGQERDAAPQVTFAAKPAGVISVAADGFVTPLASGTATVTASGPEGLSAAVRVAVEKFDEQIPINFGNQIVPIFTKLGCNSGGCHGKSSGQNGFKLSLLGFYPEEDYEFLVKEARGRRLFPAAPERSLLLLKATNTIAHGGGMRIDRDSYEYALLKSWIEQGMPFGSKDDPTITRIEAYPPLRTMDRGARQQIAVYAHFSDGSVRDVTRVAQFEPNDTEMAEVSKTGVVRTLDLTGQAAVMVRFQGAVSVFRASIPMGLKVDDRLPKPRNFVDELVFAKLSKLGIPPSAASDDGMFLRRVCLDLTGKLPTADEARAFLEDKDNIDNNIAKRDKLIDRLLESNEYADFFANKWSTILRNRRTNQNYTRGTYAFYQWIRDSVRSDKPYDQFVREIVAASGEISDHPPVAWYRTLRTATDQLEDTAQLFLGVRIQCARCHHHPFEQWSQRDYAAFQAFFSRVARKPGIHGLQLNDEPRIYHNRGLATEPNPRNMREQLKPTGLGGQPLELSEDDDPRQALADWMAEKDNPFFARALVNRYWKHFFGRGIVEPEDDMRITNPPSNPELLDGLAKSFIDGGFRIRPLVRTILQSQTYQLSSEPNEYNLIDRQCFSRYYPKRMNAEVVFDAINQVTANRPNFPNLPQGTRAVQLPDAAITNYFLSVFGKPEGASPCECERSTDANLAQILHLMMSREVEGKLRARPTQLLVNGQLSDKDRVRELYLWAFARYPSDEELKFNLAYLDKKPFGERLQAYEDMLWALLNAKEFSFVR
jgi:hypothetical protein